MKNNYILTYITNFIFAVILDIIIISVLGYLNIFNNFSKFNDYLLILFLIITTLCFGVVNNYINYKFFDKYLYLNVTSLFVKILYILIKGLILILLSPFIYIFIYFTNKEHGFISRNKSILELKFTPTTEDSEHRSQLVILEKDKNHRKNVSEFRVQIEKNNNTIKDYKRQIETLTTDLNNANDKELKIDITKKITRLNKNIDDLEISNHKINFKIDKELDKISE